MVPPDRPCAKVREKDVSAVTTLLAHRIKTFTLRRDAPFPSEIRDAHDLVRNWRFAQRLHLVRSDDSVRTRDSDDSDTDPLEAA